LRAVRRFLQGDGEIEKIAPAEAGCFCRRESNVPKSF
jgi:hypothetical protein